MDLREPAATAGGDLARKLERLPPRPGVYIYRNQKGKPIYVGKAKSLRNRVRSYFQPSAQHPPRIARMVAEVADLDFIVVDTEMEALILESNLVKRERPRFNVLLRDDKQFPYLKLSTRDPYPRVSLVRRARIDGQVYVGPFLPAAGARKSMKLVQRHFQVATCKEVFDGKRRPCLYYHLDQCLAPCAGKTTPEEYGQAVGHVRLFLEGRHRDLERSLEQEMRQASEARHYERAARNRDTLATVRGLAVKQRMASVGLEEQDYLAHFTEGGQLALQVFQVREGRVQSRREFTIDELDFEVAEFYSSVLAQYYQEQEPPREIYLPALPANRSLLGQWLAHRRGSKVRLAVPVRGGKKRFLDLVGKNARLAFESAFRSHHAHGVRSLDALQEMLDLDEPPFRIECFDISNVQGTDAVASMVVWEGGKPRKSDYRSFNIKGVEGPDDYASIAEAVTRRYSRLIAEERRLPDLVLIDGGAGQLGSAVTALAQVGLSMLPVASIAKREEEVYLQSREEPIRAPRNSPALQLIQRIRDEAHRFAVTHHRRRRKRRTLKTELTDIAGVGPVIARRLLTALGSVEGVRRAAPARLREVAGAKVADAILLHYGRADS